MPGIFPDRMAPIVRNADGGRELAMLRWGMPSSSQAIFKKATTRAEKLAAKSVIGVDIDPQAIESARFNAERNRCNIEFSLPKEFGIAHPATEKFDVVVANILSSPLKLMAPMLSGRVAPGGSLILSGVLSRQAEEVAAAYAPFITLTVWAEHEGWVALSGNLAA